MAQKDFSKVNQTYWDARVERHVDSDFYDQVSFLEGRNSLNAYELELLGDIREKKIIHFQCHFGQDTISMARMGASCVGIDLSPEAVQKANALAKQLDQDAEFLCSNVLETDKHTAESFDIVFTSYGTIVWLPDLKPWAKQVAKRLKPGGKFVMVDFHPVIHMLDDDTMSNLNYSYFNKGLISGTDTGSYTDGDAIPEEEYHTWNHSLSSLWAALKENGIELDRFEEYEHSPYPCFPNMIASSEGYQFKGMEGKLPVLFGVVGTKK